MKSDGARPIIAARRARRSVFGNGHDAPDPGALWQVPARRGNPGGSGRLARLKGRGHNDYRLDHAVCLRGIFAIVRTGRRLGGEYVLRQQ
jgi:hypothetical protein